MERLAITTTEYAATAALFPEAGEGFCVTATTAAGEVFVYRHTDLAEEDARGLAKAVGLAGQITAEFWSYWRTVYGSRAFAAEEAAAGIAASLIRQGLADEADFEGTRVGALL